MTPVCVGHLLSCTTDSFLGVMFDAVDLIVVVVIIFVVLVDVLQYDPLINQSEPPVIVAVAIGYEINDHVICRNS